MKIIKEHTMARPEENLAKANISLPKAATPVASYVACRREGKTLYISGQLPMAEGTIKYIGKVGRDLDVEEAKQAAHLCGLNILAQLKLACDGNLDLVEGCIRLGGFINCTDDFKDHPQVINGASDLMVLVFGEAGRHARTSVGVNSLPFNASVEIDAMFTLKD